MTVQRIDWWDNDPLFFDQLRQGHEWELYVAEQLRQEGIDVFVEPFRVRESKNEVPSFANQADIVAGKDYSRKIEVKSRNYAFTSRDDLPWPDLLVCTVRSWEGAEQKPWAIVNVSTITKAMVVIPGKSRKNWTTRAVPDRTRNITDMNYVAKPSDIYPFSTLVRALKEEE